MLNVVQPFYTLVASDDWLDYPTYPEDYQGVIEAPPYLKICVVGGSVERIGYSTHSKGHHGLICVKIVTDIGLGQLVPATIGDELAQLLDNRRFSPQLVTGYGSVQTIGQDPDDKTKILTEYSVPFQYYGD